MNAGQVAGLLILLGVVGVLAAIVGSGIEAGPVKFPSIPGSRQKPLALASALVIVGGATWLALQHRSGSGNTSPTTTASTGPEPSSKLRVTLIPDHSDVQVGHMISVSAEVYDSLGQELGRGECRLSWTDALSKWSATTQCIARVTEPSVSQPGVHRIVATAEGRGGLLASGAGTVDVTVH